MIIELTKEFVIKALTEEPNVRTGYGWIHEFGPKEGAEKNCPACAVGTVMRAAMRQTHSPDAIHVAAEFATRAEYNDVQNRDVISVSGVCGANEAEIFRMAARAVTAGRPLRALSFVFESLSRATTGHPPTNSWDRAAIKSRTIHFVREYFPKKFLADINGFKPAKDVKVVSP